MIDYKSAGVDIRAGNEVVKRIKQSVKSTFSDAVLADIGGFGALYDLKVIAETYRHPVLVQSIDGVGTKAIIARLMNQYQNLGADLVSATANDIIVLGAKPLTLLDYIANDTLNPDIVEKLVLGMVKACKENNISLVGGETAEMPGTYLPGEHDVVGVITGVVEKEKILLGKDIVPGDAVFAFLSSGLHTNGYSLARKLLFEKGKFSVDSYLPELQHTLGDVLLVPHLNYTRPVLHLLENTIPIKGMAHITGGGLLENIPRILPEGCGVELTKSAWPEQPLFTLLQQLGDLTEEESYRTFNMGIGLVMIGDPSLFEKAKTLLQDMPGFVLYRIGNVVHGEKKVILQ